LKKIEFTLKENCKSKRRKKRKGVFYSEMRYGTFERAIALPTTVKAEEAKAEYRGWRS